MLQWFRLHAGRIAAVTMLTMAAVGGSTVVPHHDDCHDAACRSVAVKHDESAHRIGSAPTTVGEHAQHCLVCHWIRAFRPRTESRVVSVEASDAGIRIPVTIVALSGRAPVAQPPLRSPPSSELTA